MFIDNQKQIYKIIKDVEKNNKPLKTLDKLILLFINEFQLKLKNSSEFIKYPDLAALHFLLRKSNIEKIVKNYNTTDRVGLGMVFHITPSNMPTNFFYSYIFGLLAGNVNVVKIPNKNFYQINVLLKILANVLKNKKFKKIKKMSYFIRYKIDNKITQDISSKCNARVIWGGDKSINEIRQINIPSKSREITFSDKFSCSLLNLEKISNLKENELRNLCNYFFSDGYFIDQNACSSPHLVIWLGKKNYKAKNSFWSCLNSVAKIKYHLPEIGVVDKFSQECEDAVTLNIKKKKYDFNNKLIIKELNKIPINLTSLRGKWGYFYEYEIKKLPDIAKFISNKFQTITYFGIERKKIVNTIIDYHIKGVDRVVPVGNAHLMDTKWDGHDLIYSLSRIIN